MLTPKSLKKLKNLKANKVYKMVTPESLMDKPWASNWHGVILKVTGIGNNKVYVDITIKPNIEAIHLSSSVGKHIKFVELSEDEYPEYYI